MQVEFSPPGDLQIFRPAQGGNVRNRHLISIGNLVPFGNLFIRRPGIK